MREKRVAADGMGAYRREVKAALSITRPGPPPGHQQARTARNACDQSSLLSSTNCLRRLARPSVSAACALDRALGHLGFFGAATRVSSGATSAAGLTGSRFDFLCQKSDIFILASYL